MQTNATCVPGQVCQFKANPPLHTFACENRFSKIVENFAITYCNQQNTLTWQILTFKMV